MKLSVCVTTPYMPITTDGKEPNLLPLFASIKDTVESACRKAKAATATSRGTGAGDSMKDVILAHIREAINAASGDGQHRFSLRQLFYAVRPFTLETLGEEPTYKYFADVVTGYESGLGHDVPKMYRDPRGALYHPHTGETITLGTLNVEKYKRPELRFNKVLYIEKGGFLPLLIDNKWPERHDCAILTSQGFATRAARDVIDLMGDTDEQIRFFCIHDADGPGTGIYEALTEATKARPRRRVEVVNLGLEPWEAVTMGLAVEKVSREKGDVSVADYVRRKGSYWYTWLQSNRVELNAMTSPRFLKWLDEKMEEHDTFGKVVPAAGVLESRFTDTAQKIVREQIVERLLAEAGIDQLVEHAMQRVRVPAGDRLHIDVRRRLQKTPAEPWEVPLLEIVKQAVAKGNLR